MSHRNIRPDLINGTTYEDKLIHMTFLKGLHYNNILIHNLITKLKFKGFEKLRFDIAKNLIRDGESVLDICSGPAKLRKFLPETCTYAAVEMSPKFIDHLQKNNVQTCTINYDVISNNTNPKLSYFKKSA